MSQFAFGSVGMESKERLFSHRCLALYGGHEDEVNCLVFSNDLEILLTASIDGFIRLWNTVFDHLTCKIHENAGMCDRSSEGRSCFNKRFIFFFR